MVILISVYRIFQIALMGGGIPPWGKSEILPGQFFLLGGGNLKRSGSDHSNLFQS